MQDTLQFAACVAILFTLTPTGIKPVSADDGTLFNPLIEPNSGSAFCVTDTPSAVVSLASYPGFPRGVPEPVQCGLLCSGFDGCVGFNYIRPMDWSITGGECDLFVSTPQNCSTNCTSCWYYQMFDQKGSCKRFYAFDRIDGTNLYFKPIFGSYTWGEATKACLELSPFAHLAVINTISEYQALKTYLGTFPATVSSVCNFDVLTNPGEYWYGYWSAMRRQVAYTTDPITCSNSPFIWVSDNTTGGQQILDANTLTTLQNAGMTIYADCTTNYPTNVYPSCETCTSFTIKVQFLLNSVNCWWPQCPLCQLDAD